MRGALALLVALAPLGARAQEVLPCRADQQQPTDTVAAFEAEGWTFLPDEPGREDAREAALAGPLLAHLLATALPERPATSEALDALVAQAAEPRRLRRFENALVFARGDEAAVVEFDGLGDGTSMLCWLTAPHLPRIDALDLREFDLGDQPRAVAFAHVEAPLPPGATRISIDAVRLVPGVPPAAPIPGADAITVLLERESPRIVLPQVHGPLRAFAPSEMSEALRVPGEGGE